MTVVLAKRTFRHPVIMKMSGDMGELITVTFSATFKRLKATEVKNLFARINAGRLAMVRAQAAAAGEPLPDAPVDAPTPITDTELLDLVLVNLHGLTDEAGAEVPYSPEMRVQTNEDWPGFEAAIVLSYLDSFSLQPKEAEKNSAALLSTS